jgi:hypothetical protein
MSSIPSSSEAVSRTNALSPEFDWQSGQIHFPLAQEYGKSHEWSLVVCGDWAPRLTHQQAIVENPCGFYGDLLPIIQGADLTIVNLEGVLTDDNLQPIAKDGIILHLPTKTITGLSIVPFHLACIANNHIFDYGTEGLIRTQKILERHHIQSVGAGLCAEEAEKARFFQFGNTRLAVVNVAEGEEARPLNGGPGIASLDLPRLQAQLPSLRAQADVVLVVVHAGREYLPVPAPYIQSMYHSIVDAGADLVVGHHPHVPQGIELYRDVPIAYSLGNFVLLTDAPSKYLRLGYFLKARFCGPELSVLEIWPYRIGPNGLSLLADERLASFLLELEQLSALAADDNSLADIWNAYVDSQLVSLELQELADSIALLGGEALLVRSALKASLSRFDGDSFADWLARRAIWHSINWLARKIRSEKLVPESWRLAQMRRGASILRNRFDTLAHRELYLTALQRVMDGKLGHAPDWATESLIDWEVFWMNGK